MKLLLVGLFALLVAASHADAAAGIFKGSFDTSVLTGLFKKLTSIFGKLENFLVTKKKPVTAKVEVDGRPKFCKSLECPPFAVANKTKFYQLRCYSSANWVSTKAIGYPSPMGFTSSQMFMKLFKYIRGANKQNASIDMTAPVLVSIKGEKRKKDLTMSFYVPSKFQQSVPMPTDSSIFVEKKKFCAYVHSFSGFVFTFRTYQHHIKMLKMKLKAGGLRYDSSHFLTAGYDKPTTFSRRHNEVMLLKN